MSTVYPTSELITSMRSLGMIPDTSAEGSEDADLLRWASEGIRIHLFPDLVATQEEYGLFRSRSTITAGVRGVRLPHRAAWGKLRDLWCVHGGRRQRLRKIEQEELDATGISATGFPLHYLLENYHVILVPDLSSSFSGELEFVFYVTPGDLVIETAARQIPAGGVNTTTKTVTFGAAIPSTWATTSKFDVHSEFSGAEVKMIEETVTAASGSALTFTNAIDGSVFGTKALSAGDWVCLAGQSVIPALPAELHPLVARAAALTAAETIKDRDGIQIHGSLLEAYMKKALAMMETRVESRPWRVQGRGGLLGARNWPRR